MTRKLTPSFAVLAASLILATGPRGAIADDEDVRPVRVGSRLVDLTDGSIIGEASGTRREKIELDGQAVVRRAKDGTIIWSTALAGRVGGVRPPELVVAGETVIVAVDAGLVALDRESGAIAWRADGPNDRLHARGDLVFGLLCGGGKPLERPLVARRVSDGKKVWETRLPDDVDPESMRDVGELLLVCENDFQDDSWSRFYELDGTLRFELAEVVCDARPTDDGGVIVLTEARLAAIGPDGKTRWESVGVAGEPGLSFGGGKLIALPGGDVIAMAYMSMADSGVDLVRVRPTDGSLVWKARAEPLGVPHSKYWHRPRLEPRGEQLIVVSEASGGCFVEVRETASGALVRRFNLSRR